MRLNHLRKIKIMLNSQFKHLLQRKISYQRAFVISLSPFFLITQISLSEINSTLTNAEEISASCTMDNQLLNSEGQDGGGPPNDNYSEIEKRKKKSQEFKYRFMRFFFGHLSSCIFSSFSLIMLYNYYFLSGCMWALVTIVSHRYGSEHLNPIDQDWRNLEKENEGKKKRKSQ